MLEYIRNNLTNPLLQSAERSLLRGDYGTALYQAGLVNTFATNFMPDKETARISGDLASLVQGLIEADFAAIAEQRGLTITPENRVALLQEHSPHYVRFRELLTQPIPKKKPLMEKNTSKYIIKEPFENKSELYLNKFIIPNK